MNPGRSLGMASFNNFNQFDGPRNPSASTTRPPIPSERPPPYNFKNGSNDTWGFKREEREEGRAGEWVIDWVSLIYSGVMLLFMITNVVLLAWIGASSAHSVTLQADLEKLAAFNDNLLAVKSTNAQIALALKATNEHLLMTSLNQLSGGNRKKTTTMKQAYLDKYVGNGQLGSGIQGEGAVPLKIIVAEGTTCTVAGAGLSYLPLGCEVKTIDRCLPEQMPLLPSSSLNPYTTQIAPAGLQGSCMNSGSPLDLRTPIGGSSSRLDESNAKGAVSATIELLSFAVTTAEALTSDTTYKAKYKAHLEAYFAAETALQTAFQTTYSACCIEPLGENCDSHLVGHTSAQDGYVAAFGSLYNGMSTMRETLYSAVNSAQGDDGQKATALAALTAVSEQLTQFYGGVDSENVFYPTLYTIRSYAASGDEANWCQAIDYDVFQNNPVVSIQKCTTIVSNAVYLTDAGPKKAAGDNVC